MPWRRNRLTCKVCKRHRDEAGPLSARGKCQICALTLMVENITQMVEHRGPNFDKWRRSMAASVGAELRDG